MADHHGAAGKGLQAFFQRLQGFHIEIVGRLIQQEEVAAAAQHLGEVHAVAFPARELPDIFLLVSLLEVKCGNIGTRVDLDPAKVEHVQPIGDFLPDIVGIIQRIAALVDIAELHRVAEAHRTGIGFFNAEDHLEQGRLTRPVRTDHADNAARRQREGEILDQEIVAEALAQVLNLQHQVAEAGPRGNADLRGRDLLALGLARHFLIALDTRLGLGLAGLGAGAHPFQFALQRALLVAFRAAFLRHPLGLLLQPVGIVPLIGNAAPTIELQDPPGDVIEEIAVVGDQDHAAIEIDQIVLKPGHRLGVEMVRRLVHQDHVGL